MAQRAFSWYDETLWSNPTLWYLQFNTVSSQFSTKMVQYSITKPQFSITWAQMVIAVSKFSIVMSQWGFGQSNITLKDSVISQNVVILQMRIVMTQFSTVKNLDAFPSSTVIALQIIVMSQWNTWTSPVTVIAKCSMVRESCDLLMVITHCSIVTADCSTDVKFRIVKT